MLRLFCDIEHIQQDAANTQSHGVSSNRNVTQLDLLNIDSKVNAKQHLVCAI